MEGPCLCQVSPRIWKTSTCLQKLHYHFSLWAPRGRQNVKKMATEKRLQFSIQVSRSILTSQHQFKIDLSCVCEGEIIQVWQCSQYTYYFPLTFKQQPHNANKPEGNSMPCDTPHAPSFMANVVHFERSL